MKIEMNDKVFQEYKNIHVYKAFQTINQSLQSFQENSKTAKFHKGKSEDVKSVLKEFP